MRLERLAAISALAIGCTPAYSQTFQKQVFRVGQDTVVGSHRFRLEGPDNPDAPTVWEGPLRITNGKTTCESPVSLVGSVWAQSGAKFAIVVADSGSSTYVHFIDTLSCGAKWPRIKAFTEGVSIVSERIQILPGCDCGKTGAPCSCSAAQVYRLSSDAAPMLLKDESRALTKKYVGVTFSGTRKVLHPKTAQARLM